VDRHVDRDAQVDALVVLLEVEAAALVTAALGDVGLGQDLDASREHRGQGDGQIVRPQMTELDEQVAELQVPPSRGAQPGRRSSAGMSFALMTLKVACISGFASSVRTRICPCA